MPKGKIILEAISRRYAKAIFDLAAQDGRVEDILKELETFALSLKKVPMLATALGDKEVLTSKKKEVLKEISGVLGLSALVSNFMSLLVEKKRFELFESIHVIFKKMSDVYAGLARAKIEVASVSLAKDFKERLEKVLKDLLKKNVVCEVSVNKDLIGGARIRIGDHKLDSSVAGRLAMMEQELS